MQYCLFIILLLAGIVNAAPVTVQKMSYKGIVPRFGSVAEPGQIKMPFVVSEDKNLASKINLQLFVKLLTILPPVKYSEFFVTPSGSLNDDVIVGQEFSVARNDGKILTIFFNQTGVGAHEGSSTFSVSFDLSGGREILIGELLTPKGLKIIGSTLNRKIEDEYKSGMLSFKKELTELKQESLSDESFAEIKSNLESSIELANSCAGGDGHADRSPGAVEESNYADRSNWGLTNNEFQLTNSGGCFPYYARGMDPVSVVSVLIPFTQLEPQMTPYAKHLLLSKGAATAPDATYGHVLKGFLGTKTPVTMYVNKTESGQVSGYYFYDKYQKSIEINGKEIDGNLELSEKDAEGNDQLRFHLKVLPNQLRGRWVGNKEFEFNVSY